MFNEKTNQEIFAFLKKQPIEFILPMVEEKFKQEKIKITAIFFNENQISIDFIFEVYTNLIFIKKNRSNFYFFLFEFFFYHRKDKFNRLFF